MLKTEYNFSEVHKLATQIEAGNDKVHFHPILSTDNGGVILVAFKAGQKLETHVAPMELMVNVLEGEVEFTVADKIHHLREGEFLLLGRDVPHSVLASADSKLMLVKLKA